MKFISSERIWDAKSSLSFASKGFFLKTTIEFCFESLLSEVCLCFVGFFQTDLFYIRRETW